MFNLHSILYGKKSWRSSLGRQGTNARNNSQKAIKKIKNKGAEMKTIKKRSKDYPLEIQVDSLTDSFTINQFKGEPTSSPTNPLTALIKKESFDNLSREAKFIIALIIWSPLDLFTVTKQTTKMTIDDITRFGGKGVQVIKIFLTRRMGLWPFQAAKVINEIEEYSKNI